MTYTVKVVWRVLGRLAENVRSYEQPAESSSQPGQVPASDLLFNVKTGKSFLAEIGGRARCIPIPDVLEPTHIFYNALRPTIIENYPIVQGKRLPVDILLQGDSGWEQKVRITISLHAYGRTLCAIVQTSEFNITDASILSSVQDISKQSGVTAVLKKALGIAEKRDKYAHPRTGGLNSFPSVQIISESGAPELSSLFLTRLVTRHPGANESIAEAQFAKNNIHQIDSTILLCDRQGIVAYAPGTSTDHETSGLKRRFRSAGALLELGAVTQKILQSTDPLSSNRFAEIENAINESEAILANSMSTYNIWSLVKANFSLIASLRARKIMESKNLNEASARGSILCMAAANVEFKQIKSSLEQRFGAGKNVKLGEGKNYDVLISFLDNDTQMNWYLAPQLAQGVTSAAVDVQRIADAIRPDLIMMIGMCMAMPAAKIKPGCVIVPNSITLLDHQRFKGNTTVYRPRGELLATGLHNLARIAATTSSLPFDIIVDKGLACASVKIEDVNSGLVPFISAYLPDVVAFDMEGWGFYQGTAKYESVWIKAVADSGEPQEESQDKRVTKQTTQANVTENALTFALLVVKNYCDLANKTARSA